MIEEKEKTEKENHNSLNIKTKINLEKYESIYEFRLTSSLIQDTCLPRYILSRQSLFTTSSYLKCT
jgi:hypothetical protein